MRVIVSCEKGVVELLDIDETVVIRFIEMSREVLWNLRVGSLIIEFMDKV
ncbi:hypothetical protein LZ906_009050 [Paraclostridium ghonii]|nr:hypothetical protein [Paeniclostridium ghonii]MCM0167981.1 hypothetical protein [Paeniclostridium ghonii]